jgi:hypothetical protein
MWLSEAPEHTLGLSSLAGRCQQSLSAISRTVFDHLEGIDLDALGDALQRITAAADHRTTVPR